MKDIEVVVSENIQKLIEEYNLSNVKLAKIAGVSESTVGKWILQKATPRMGAIQKISDHFNIPKSYILKEDDKAFQFPIKEYPYLPTTISAGLPIDIEGITQADKISLPDSVMGKWSGNKDVFIVKANGQSMNKTIPDQSLMAVKPIELDNLKDGDIVVYSSDHDYSVKRYYNDTENKRIIFRPHSTERIFIDDIYTYDNLDSLIIHGKVVVYIVELD